MPRSSDSITPTRSNIRNGLYIVVSFAAYLGMSRLIDHASTLTELNAFFSEVFWLLTAAFMLAAIFAVILSPVWVVFFIPRRLLPDGVAVFFMLGVCNAVLPAIPAFSSWVLWQYL